MFLVILFFPFTTFSQNDTNRILFGAFLGKSLITYGYQGIPVNPYFSNSVETGISLVIPISNFNIKSGVEFTYFRSPLLNNNNYYEEFLQVPILFNLAGNIQHSKFSFFIGPEASLLIRQGIASPNDQFYTFTSETFGKYYKIGMTSEITYNLWDANNNLHSFGLRFYQDIPNLFSNNTITKIDRYITGTLYYSVLLSSLNPFSK